MRCCRPTSEQVFVLCRPSFTQPTRRATRVGKRPPAVEGCRRRPHRRQFSGLRLTPQLTTVESRLTQADLWLHRARPASGFLQVAPIEAASGHPSTPFPSSLVRGSPDWALTTYRYLFPWTLPEPRFGQVYESATRRTSGSPGRERISRHGIKKGFGTCYNHRFLNVLRCQVSN